MGSPDIEVQAIFAAKFHARFAVLDHLLAICSSIDCRIQSCALEKLGVSESFGLSCIADTKEFPTVEVTIARERLTADLMSDVPGA